MPGTTRERASPGWAARRASNATAGQRVIHALRALGLAELSMGTGVLRVVWNEAPILPDERFLRSRGQQGVQPTPPYC